MGKTFLYSVCVLLLASSVNAMMSSDEATGASEKSDHSGKIQKRILKENLKNARMEVYALPNEFDSEHPTWIKYKRLSDELELIKFQKEHPNISEKAKHAYLTTLKFRGNIINPRFSLKFDAEEETTCYKIRSECNNKPDDNSLKKLLNGICRYGRTHSRSREDYCFWGKSIRNMNAVKICAHWYDVKGFEMNPEDPKLDKSVTDWIRFSANCSLFLKTEYINH